MTAFLDSPDLILGTAELPVLPLVEEVLFVALLEPASKPVAFFGIRAPRVFLPLASDARTAVNFFDTADVDVGVCLRACGVGLALLTAGVIRLAVVFDVVVAGGAARFRDVGFTGSKSSSSSSTCASSSSSEPSPPTKSSSDSDSDDEST